MSMNEFFSFAETFIFSAILLIVAYFNILKPKTVWELSHLFTVLDGTPTPFALNMIRLSGALALALLAYILLFK